MKKPIDPNLESFDNDELLNSIESADTNESNNGTSFEFDNQGFAVPPSNGQRITSVESKAPSDFRMKEKQYHHSSHSHHHHSSSHSHSKRKKKMPAAAKIAIAVLAIILVLIVGVFGSFFFLENKGKNSMTNNVTTQTNYEEKIS